MTSPTQTLEDVRTFYSALEGEWQGRYHLWLTPATPVQESDSLAIVARVAGKAAWTLRYRWAESGRSHEGEFRFEGERDQARFDWTDTFHSPSSPMTGEGKLSKDGAKLVFASSYPTGPGQPDWGWRTELTRVDAKTFLLEAYNITPEGQEALAVRCRYTKR